MANEITKTYFYKIIFENGEEYSDHDFATVKDMVEFQEYINNQRAIIVDNDADDNNATDFTVWDEEGNSY